MWLLQENVRQASYYVKHTKNVHSEEYKKKIDKFCLTTLNTPSSGGFSQLVQLPATPGKKIGVQ